MPSGTIEIVALAQANVIGLASRESPSHWQLSLGQEGW